MIDMHDDECYEDMLNEYTESSIASDMNQSDFRIRKYKSVISLSSDNTSSVQTVPQQVMSKSSHQSPVKPSRTPKIMDVSPQYFSGCSSQSNSKDQGGSRVKQLLFRRMSRSSGVKSTDIIQKESISKRSKSSSSPDTKSNIRFLRKKTSDNEEKNYLLNFDDDDDLDISPSSIHTNIITSQHHALSYSSGIVYSIL